MDDNEDFTPYLPVKVRITEPTQTTGELLQNTHTGVVYRLVSEKGRRAVTAIGIMDGGMLVPYGRVCIRSEQVEGRVRLLDTLVVGDTGLLYTYEIAAKAYRDSNMDTDLMQRLDRRRAFFRWRILGVVVGVGEEDGVIEIAVGSK